MPTSDDLQYVLKLIEDIGQKNPGFVEKWKKLIYTATHDQFQKAKKILERKKNQLDQRLLDTNKQHIEKLWAFQKEEVQKAFKNEETANQKEEEKRENQILSKLNDT